MWHMRLEHYSALSYALGVACGAQLRVLYGGGHVDSSSLLYKVKKHKGATVPCHYKPKVQKPIWAIFFFMKIGNFILVKVL